MKQTADEVAYKLFPDSIAAYKGFIDGAAWQAKQSPWIMAKEQLPYIKGEYEESDPVIVILQYSKMINPKILKFIRYFNSWATIEGDYKQYKVSDNDLWMPIPKINE